MSYRHYVGKIRIEEDKTVLFSIHVCIKVGEKCQKYHFVLQWVSFWIQPEAAPARVTLGVTSLLTLSTQHAKSQASLPPVSYLKAVDAFMSACTLYDHNANSSLPLAVKRQM